MPPVPSKPAPQVTEEVKNVQPRLQPEETDFVEEEEGRLSAYADHQPVRPWGWWEGGAASGPGAGTGCRPCLTSAVTGDRGTGGRRLGWAGCEGPAMDGFAGCGGLMAGGGR